MTDLPKRCGTCVYYALPDDYAVYDCAWPDTHPLPEAFDNRAFPLPNEGQNCQTWEPRTDGEVTVEHLKAAGKRIRDYWDGQMGKPIA